MLGPETVRFGQGDKFGRTTVELISGYLVPVGASWCSHISVSASRDRSVPVLTGADRIRGGIASNAVGKFFVTVKNLLRFKVQMI